MVVKRQLFAAACILALALVSEVYGQNQCATAMWGIPLGKPVILQTVLLYPPIRDWKITIGNPCIGEPNGEIAKGCDYDSPPFLQFQDAFHLFVKRTGDVEGIATVDITVYCQKVAYEDLLQKSGPLAEPIIPKKASKLID